MNNHGWLYVFLGILAAIVIVGMSYIAFRPREVLSWVHSRKQAKEIDRDLDELFKR